MSAKSTISKEIFAPQDERMLGAVQVKRRTKKKIPFLATGGQGEYQTYICLSVTNKKPTQASITKVKQFEGSTSFVRRSQWALGQLRQVNGIDPNRDSPEFDLLFENAFDQWVASTASEKCTFFQILHHTCQRYLTDKKPEFINCQSKIMGAGHEAQMLRDFPSPRPSHEKLESLVEQFLRETQISTCFSLPIQWKLLVCARVCMCVRVCFPGVSVGSGAGGLGDVLF
uniref:Syntaxin binding protein 6 n=1 Tax=Ornithorhynchus anatinus TaxID=9258 RepID=A0A6I8P8H2_ORNAN